MILGSGPNPPGSSPSPGPGPYPGPGPNSGPGLDLVQDLDQAGRQGSGKARGGRASGRAKRVYTFFRACATSGKELESHPESEVSKR